MIIFSIVRLIVLSALLTSCTRTGDRIASIDGDCAQHAASRANHERVYGGKIVSDDHIAAWVTKCRAEVLSESGAPTTATASSTRPFYLRPDQNHGTSDLYDCADFSSPDSAQRKFIRNGGPQLDPYDLDRDADGFACEYDPYPSGEPRG